MISIAYQFKPKARQVDQVRLAVDDLRAQGFHEMNISRFYDYAAERALADDREDPGTFARDLKIYLDRRGEIE